jgi:hypothetical protein
VPTRQNHGPAGGGECKPYARSGGRAFLVCSAHHGHGSVRSVMPSTFAARALQADSTSVQGLYKGQGRQGSRAPDRRAIIRQKSGSSCIIQLYEGHYETEVYLTFNRRICSQEQLVSRGVSQLHSDLLASTQQLHGPENLALHRSCFM